MLNIFKKLKRKKPIMYEFLGKWGNRIEWQTFKERVTGWKQRRPEVGDLIRMPMQSGNDGVWRFTKVKYMLDPTDMFFGDVEAIGYLEDYKGAYIPEAQEKVTFLL